MVAIQPPDSPEHDIGRQMADAKIMLRSQAFDEPALIRRTMQNAFGGIVEIGEIVAASGEKAPHFQTDRCIDRPDADGRPGPLIRQGKLLAIGGVQPQERLGETR